MSSNKLTFELPYKSSIKDNVLGYGAYLGLKNNLCVGAFLKLRNNKFIWKGKCKISEKAKKAFLN